MTDLVERLTAHKLLGAAPREELAWLASHGSLRTLAEGDVLFSKGSRVENMFIVLEGRVALAFDRGAGRRRIVEVRPGEIVGLLPFSRMVHSPADGVAQSATTVLTIHRVDVRAMIHDCEVVASLLVHEMVDRSRLGVSNDLHDEKMISLGKLSAGLAHELNNPVSAIARSAALLDDRLADAERATRALEATALTASQRAAAEAVRASCATARPSGVLSPLERADREDAIAGWLVNHGLDGGLAGALGETAISLDSLDELARAVTGPSLDAVLQWVAAGCAVQGLTSEIRDAAMRISGLVAAVKGFTHMDQAAVAEPVDLASSVANTIAVLNAKARAKSVGVVVNLDAHLPRVHGFVGELNQIWANLIDNALDAAPEAGRVEETATHERQRMVVRVIDNGTGIPPDAVARIFDPFFTTKPIGQGTGLGLDIVRRLVLHNEAEIDVESRPGRTEFRVSLPIAEKDAAAGV